MKRELKEKDTDARILINEKGVFKDKIQKMEVLSLHLLTITNLCTDSVLIFPLASLVLSLILTIIERW